MFEFLTLKSEAFGLDISDLSLKIIKLKRKRKFLGLASFNKAEIKPGIIENIEIKDEEALANIIKEAISKVEGEKIKTKYVVASLPEEKAFLQVIQMPLMKEEELKKAVYFEAENYIPLPIEEVYLDFQIVKPIFNHLDHLDVLIAAMPKKIVDSYISCLKKAGLVPKVLEVESQAIARALIKNEVIPFPLLLIDLEATRTSFIMFSGYSLRFTASIPVSSQKFTGAISKVLKVDLKEAEKLKIKYGLREKHQLKTENSTKKEIGRGKIFEAIAPLLRDLIEQIKTYLVYYRTHVHHEHLPVDAKEVEKIFLCGKGANLKGLSDFLSLELKIPVELGNPWVNILPEPLKEVPELPFETSLGYTTALGLALRGVQPTQGGGLVALGEKASRVMIAPTKASP
ncbi:type IV pilus assembly protein PilM [Patescibacteria group bacterium]|nr:type IV pilus assembly protein PilM [Patescibacteria group bacterium]